MTVVRVERKVVALLPGKKSSWIGAALTPLISLARGRSKSVRATGCSSAPTTSGLVSLMELALGDRAVRYVGFEPSGANPGTLRPERK